MHREILPHVIFSPAALALELASGLQALGHDSTLFTPGPVATSVRNITADLSYFKQELDRRGDTYTDLLRKHPFTFISLARQVQGELVARAYQMANNGELDIVHVYSNEEELALSFAALCTKPVVFTHHDPFNFLVKYKSVMPKYAGLNWISLSYAQRKGMPADTHWIANIYHGLPEKLLTPMASPALDYVAYLGRIIEPKGVHLAIDAVERYNQEHMDAPLTLKIAGKHYSGNGKDTYWSERIHPRYGKHIVNAGFVTAKKRRSFLANARALLVPSIFEEPFGMVVIEALACGTPVIGLDSGAIPELITSAATGAVVRKQYGRDGSFDEAGTVPRLAAALATLDSFDRRVCRRVFEARFTSARMCREYADAYRTLIESPDRP